MRQVAWFSAGLFLILMLILAKYLFKFFSPLILGFMIALIIHPFVDRLERRGVSRSISSFLIILVILISLVLIMGLAINGLWQEMDQILEIFQSLITEESPFTKLTQILANLLPNDFLNLFDVIISKLSQFVFYIIRELTEFITHIPNLIFHFLVTALTSYLLIRDKPLVVSFLISTMPKEWQRKIFHFKQEVTQGLFAYIKVQLLLMIISGSLSTAGFLIIRLPYAWLLGSLVGLFDLIPLVGPSWVYLPVTIYYLANRQVTLALTIGLIWGLVLLVRNIWEPKIIGHQLGLHPLTSLLGIYLGVTILGFSGFVIGPLLMICCKAFYNIFVDIEL